MLLSGLPDAGNYREVCVALRQEHDREVAISQQLQVGMTRQGRVRLTCHFCRLSQQPVLMQVVGIPEL